MRSPSILLMAILLIAIPSLAPAAAPKVQRATGQRAPSSEEISPDSTKTESSTVKPKVDLIQGARRNTKLFMDFDAHTPNIDAILFNRDDFNDFHAIDSKQRFLYQKTEKK